MIYVLYTVHVIVCLFLILVVLLQQGKGADLSVFGGGATQAAFGARGAVSLLHKLTVWAFVAFIVTTVSIGFMTASRKASSVMSDVPAAAETAPAATEEGEAPVGAAEPMADEGGAAHPADGEALEPAAGEDEPPAGDGSGPASENGDDASEADPDEGSSDEAGE